jgi:hypothetical protein
MAKYVEWEDLQGSNKGKGGGGGRSGLFMRLEPNTTYQIRPVHKAIEFFKIFNRHDGHLRTAICEDPDKCMVLQQHPDLNAQKRYAVVVFDRGDENKLKILEGPPSVFDEFKKFREYTKADPGSNDGGDFSIEVQCPTGRKERNSTKYVVSFDKKTPFTEEEKKAVVAQKEELKLPEIFESLDDEAIEKRLFGEWEDRKQSNDQPATQSSGGSESSSSPDLDDEFSKW